MLYTRKGDTGSIKTYACNQSISKSSVIAEALGSLDEINSFLGICKIRSYCFRDLIDEVQENLFIIQAELAGANKKIKKIKILKMETLINDIEKKLPKIKTFFISGGTEESVLFDFARTIARRAERRVVSVKEEGKIKIGDNTLAYLNRLSSLLYALARISNYNSGIKENKPEYR